MYSLEVENKEDLDVVSKALKSYNEEKERIEKATNFLKTKKYKMGDYVVFSSLLGPVNILNGEIGKIVGWDFENKFYRVYFNENNPYIGIKEKFLETSKAIPESLANIDPEEIRILTVKLNQH